MAYIKNQHAYSLKNSKGGTALDLSGYDGYSIIGFQPHGRSNQAWTFQQDDDKNGWFIRSSSGKYLGIEGNPQAGAAVVAVSNPFKWDVKDSDIENARGIRILAHGTNFSLDLFKGNPANWTKIMLWGSWPGANQIWTFTELVSIEDQRTYSLRDAPKESSKVFFFNFLSSPSHRAFFCDSKDLNLDLNACFHPFLV
ncbi:ricin B lectin domain-containing protein [Suillus subaureus]|uniref:Ricin B lectin domain-containing protein n=1 Tax=Suillus subaureus TaxID=48587 RepID=A0A9P7DVZ1_9AGAM|nr:ricin B lectin domain-containing protein [Suillus subaureus]KAG1804653.1 ricin B lectin domain-containing protein [Suillus subaureus]